MSIRQPAQRAARQWSRGGSFGHTGGTQSALLTAGGGHMDGERMPNRLLAAVMAEAKVSNKGLAARVHDVAVKTGVDISPNHRSVRLWLEGTRPRDKTIPLIVAALSHKMGRTVSAAEIGFAGP